MRWSLVLLIASLVCTAGAANSALANPAAIDHGLGAFAMNGAAGADPCGSSYPARKTTDSKFFGGSRRSYDRPASLFEVCEGFGGPEKAHFTLTPAQQCAIIAAAATYAGKAYNPAGISSVCTKTDIVQAFLDHKWLGAVKGVACGYFGDIFAGSVGVLAAGATSETGPGAVAVGVATYRALAGSLKLVCGGVFIAVGTPLGRTLETHHETAVSLDIIRRGKCLHETQKKAIGIQWSAVTCTSSTRTTPPVPAVTTLVWSDEGKITARPATLVVGNWHFTHLAWSSWTAASAQGSGVLCENGSCVKGTLTLTLAQKTYCGDGAGPTVFSEMAFDAPSAHLRHSLPTNRC